jgi:hypothetical protein
MGGGPFDHESDTCDKFDSRDLRAYAGTFAAVIASVTVIARVLKRS